MIAVLLISSLSVASALRITNRHNVQNALDINASIHVYEAEGGEATCPSTHPFAFRPANNFDYCCTTSDDKYGNAGINTDGNRAARSQSCKDDDYIACSSAPCADFRAISPEGTWYFAEGHKWWGFDEMTISGTKLTLDKGSDREVEYEISELTSNSFRSAFGIATFTQEQITFERGVIAKRKVISPEGIWYWEGQFDMQIMISGTKLTLLKGWSDVFEYEISSLTSNSFRISDGLGGGSATFTTEKITFENGVIAEREVISPEGTWCEKYPKSVLCEDTFCEENPKSVLCEDTFCEENPKSVLCEDTFCAKNPKSVLCEDTFCEKYPKSVLCED